MRIKVFQWGRIEVREENLVLFMRMDVENVLWWKEQLLRRIERFHGMASNFLTGIVLTLCGGDIITSMEEGGGDRKIFSNNDLEDIKMRLSENSLVAMIRKKFTSPPFKKVINGQKKAKLGDVSLMLTISYEL